jgi:hypothetical protein
VITIVEFLIALKFPNDGCLIVEFPDSNEEKFPSFVADKEAIQFDCGIISISVKCFRKFG